MNSLDILLEIHKINKTENLKSDKLNIDKLDISFINKFDNFKFLRCPYTTINLDAQNPLDILSYYLNTIHNTALENNYPYVFTLPDITTFKNIVFNMMSTIHSNSLQSILLNQSQDQLYNSVKIHKVSELSDIELKYSLSRRSFTDQDFVNAGEDFYILRIMMDKIYHYYNCFVLLEKQQNIFGYKPILPDINEVLANILHCYCIYANMPYISMKYSNLEIVSMNQILSTGNFGSVNKNVHVAPIVINQHNGCIWFLLLHITLRYLEDMGQKAIEMLSKYDTKLLNTFLDVWNSNQTKDFSYKTNILPDNGVSIVYKYLTIVLSLFIVVSITFLSSAALMQNRVSLNKKTLKNKK